MTTASVYNAIILRIASRLKSYSTQIGIAGSATYGFALGRWGYEAGGVGGAILFTVAGLYCGGMLGIELPKAIIIAFGTITRLMVMIV